MAANTTKTVRLLPAKINAVDNSKTVQKRIRVAAYCRVSTKQEEQLHSYENQVLYYTDKVNSEPNWTLVGIFADKGITGTSTKKRDEFNKLIRLCKRGGVDMIIVKSISRFARNTADCLKYVRVLKELGVDIYFEEQGIHSTHEGAEFYITIYGCIAQSESENMSANIRWGKLQSAKQGKVTFNYKNFMGYRKSADGTPEIIPEEAEVIKLIYSCFLAGYSYAGIAKLLEERGILSPSGNKEWKSSTIQSILKNEKYKGDAILNKTYITDCISKKVKINDGIARPKYYVENSHPAIIDAITFSRVQEELARRVSKQKIKQVGTKTELSKYSSKYALTERLVCGECGTPYRRCTWSKNGKKKIVWRCINRLENGKKYCHAPSIEESVLHEAIMCAIQSVALQNNKLFETLRVHISTNLEVPDTDMDIIAIEARISEINAAFQKMLAEVSSDNEDSFDEAKLNMLMLERQDLLCQLATITDAEQKRKSANSRTEDIFTMVAALRKRLLRYDEQLIRQLLEKVAVTSKTQILILFNGGFEIQQELS